MSPLVPCTSTFTTAYVPNVHTQNYLTWYYIMYVECMNSRSNAKNLLRLQSVHLAIFLSDARCNYLIFYGVLYNEVPPP